MTENSSPFHRGEQELQARLGVRDKIEQMGRRMIRTHMSEQHQQFFSQLPLVVIGTADDAGRPWASVLAGQPGFLQATDANTLSVTTRPIYGDPLNKALVAGADIGALGIEFHSRRRNRLNGKIAQVGDDGFDIQVEQSFGNCPKYIQARELLAANNGHSSGEALPVHADKALNQANAALIAQADTFFIASQFAEKTEGAHGIDVSHRGGKPGFVIIAHETLLLFPDYSVNLMFNTLGNLLLNPKCGLLFIDFASRDTLQLTGEAEILWEPHHFKQPAEGRVMLHRLNLSGDGQADRWGHGGSFRAVYVYTTENYTYWQNELGHDDSSYGQFGENFTVTGIVGR